MPRRKPKIKLPTGKPPVPIDWDEVDKLLRADCIGTEIAPAIGISPDTLYHRCQLEKGLSFTAYAAIKKAHGDGILKVKQFEKALTGDNTMLVWLGKNRLKQKDNYSDNEITLEVAKQILKEHAQAIQTERENSQQLPS